MVSEISSIVTRNPRPADVASRRALENSIDMAGESAKSKIRVGFLGMLSPTELLPKRRGNNAQMMFSRVARLGLGTYQSAMRSGSQRTSCSLITKGATSPLVARARAAAPAAAPKLPAAGTAARRSLCSVAAEFEEQYAGGLQWLHWAMAAGFAVTLGTVKLSQWTTADTPWNGGRTKGKTKGLLMTLHKSTAVLLSAAIVPRIGLKLLTKMPATLPGGGIEHLAANLSHGLLYVAMLWMPATGMAMGYYGGKGVPFFWQFTIPGKKDKTKEDGAFAGKMFSWHKQAGGYLYYLIPLHIGGALVHVAKGHSIFSRITPGLSAVIKK